MDSKYKVGDKVRVTKKDPHYSYPFNFIEDMEQYIGNIVTIYNVIPFFTPKNPKDDGYLYRIEEDGHSYNWATSMFESITEEVIPDSEDDKIPFVPYHSDIENLKIGDEIRIKNESNYCSKYKPNQILKIVEIDDKDPNQHYRCQDLDGQFESYWIWMSDIIGTPDSLSKIFKEKGVFKVKSNYLGIIKIISLSDNPEYPVLCELEDKDQILLTDDGKFFNNPNILPII